MEIKTGFPQLLHYLWEEISARAASPLGNDVLGEFYENHITKDMDEDRRILPWEKCEEAAKLTVLHKSIISTHWPIAVLDVGCRSGRILLASSRKNRIRCTYTGVEYEWDFVAIATLNLFFNYRRFGEVLWVNQTNNNAFVESYQITLFPQGIVRILDREKSNAWPGYQQYLQAKKQTAQAQR
ncbi:MAG: hypothetical protein H7296_08005 [Bacteroidia bacterium]|nr:hypothetical protein [Bacteroidia bacterium]